MPIQSRASKPHARLTQEQAVAIFRVKASAPSAVKIAAYFGISEKTVRDIWTARTWSQETSHLDPTRTVELKQIGRPKGCRDSKPRKKRVDSKRGVSQVPREAPLKVAVHGCCFTPYESVPSFNSNDPNFGLHGVCDFSTLSDECSEYRAPSTSRVSSVDDQLYDWGEEFWTSSQNNDPFFNDWQAISA
jgi:hypothetical protein